MNQITQHIQQIIKPQKPYLFQKYGITQIGIFGSYIHGRQTPHSDLDILLDFNDTKNISLFDLTRIRLYLENLLHISIDLVPKTTLRKRIGQQILEEVQYI